MKTFLLTLAFFWLILPDIAAVHAVETPKLEEMLVTSTRTEKALLDAPAVSTVITKDEMEKRNVLTVDQAMEAVPGAVYRQHRSIMTTWPTVTLRGIPGQRRTLVLLDGVALNEPLNGGVRFAGYAPEDLERIEMVRGPFSSLYGGYAMGGVINMITKTPEKREITLRTGYGSGFKDEEAPDLWRFYLSYGDKFFDKLGLFLSYSRNSAKDFVTDFNVQSLTPPAGISGWQATTNESGAARRLIGDRGDNDWWDDNLTIKLGYDFSRTSKLNLLFVRTCLEWDSWGSGAKTYLRDAAGNPVWSYTVGATTVRESSFIMTPSMGSEINFYNVSYQTEISDLKAKLTLGLMDAEKRRHATHDAAQANRLGGPAVVSHSPSEGYQAELVFTKPLFGRHLLTFGGSYKHDWAEIKRYHSTNWRDKDSLTNLVYNSRGRADTQAFFLQDEIMLTNNLTMYLGVRHDWWKSYDGFDNDIGKPGYPKSYSAVTKNAWSPKAAIVYKPREKTSIRASYGQSFRAPVIAELYGTFLRADLATNWGNPDLKPETVTSWDLGVSMELWEGAKASLTYFENYMQDFIQNTQIDATNWRWMNVEKAEGKGIEFEAEQRFGKAMRLFFNLTHNDAVVKENAAFPATVGKKVTDIPHLMLNAGVDFRQGPFSLNLLGRYKGKIYLNSQNTDIAKNVYNAYDEHYVLDAKVSCRITKWATASLAVNNALDQSYFIGPKAPGRSWFGELALKF